MEGSWQVIASLLISVLMLGHKIGTVSEIVNAVNRRNEIEEVLNQLEGSQSQSQLPLALVKHAHRLTLRDGDDNMVQVPSHGKCWACVREGCGRAEVHGLR
jgi:hypothetical protein